MADRLPFVDAHVHFWDLKRIRYPWLEAPFTADGPNGSVEAIASTYLPADYERDARGWDVRGVVHVEAGAAPDSALLETEWLQGMAEGGELPNAIVAFVALHHPDAETLLASHAAHPAVRGVRHIVNWHPDARRTYTQRDLTRDEDWVSGFGQLAKHGLSFDLQCYPGQLEPLSRVLAAHDDVPVVIDHMGMPVLTDPDGCATWLAGMKAMAALPQVMVKLSGAGFALRPWSIEELRPLVRNLIDIFGPNRCMVASDYPTDALFGGFDETLDAYGTLAADLSEDDRRDLFGRTANRFYRLGLEV